MNWRRSASEIRWNIAPFIEGRFRPSRAAQRVVTVNPATEEPLCESAAGEPADVEVAVAVARRRFEDGCWSRLPAKRRTDVLARFADLVFEHSKQLALLDTLEMGKPIQFALHDAETFAPSLIRSWIGFADKLWGASAQIGAGPLSFNVYEPRGVVGCIAPWNFPIVNAVIKIVPALAAGNTVVLKPSEVAPSSALKLAELAMEAGLPEGVLNVVPGLGTTVGAALALHSDVDLLSFTGSTIIGRRVMELAGRSNGKPVLLECGGKSPHLVFPDVVDLDRVAEAVVKGLVWNQGQVCSAHTRLIVHDDIKEALLEKVIHLAKQCNPGDPLESSTTFGPLASPAQRDRVKQYITQGIEAGAEPALQGQIRERGGCYVSPTIFDRVRSDMEIFQREIFGPVLCVHRFNSEEEAIALANCTEYGLVATAWTRDMGRARRLARTVRAGAIFIRTAGEEEAEMGSELSHEPQKASGFGAEIGLSGLRAYSTLKLINFNGS